MSARRTQAERSDATRAALVAAARALFARDGYAGVGTEEIVRAAGVTRGALYHHFGGKEALLETVYEQIEVEFLQRIGTLVGPQEATATFAAMPAITETFIESSREHAAKR